MGAGDRESPFQAGGMAVSSHTLTPMPHGATREPGRGDGSETSYSVTGRYYSPYPRHVNPKSCL